MRCFISVNLPENIKNHLASLCAGFGDVPGANFVPKENMHITLAFLGDISEKQLSDIIQKAEDAAKNFKPFECTLGKIEAVPSRIPRLIWVSVGGGRVLGEIHAALKKILLFEDRGFSGHITLARIKDAGAAKELLRKIPQIKSAPVSFTVEYITVMKSVLTPSGAVYSPVKSIRLNQHELR